jgi:hypothetical protein
MCAGGGPRQLAVLARQPCYMPTAQIAPATAVRVNPATKTAISNRVIGQMLRIVRLNCWTVSD